MTVTTPEETAPSATGDDEQSTPAVAAAPFVTGDLLVEDVSIDGMCGVY